MSFSSLGCDSSRSCRLRRRAARATDSPIGSPSNVRQIDRYRFALSPRWIVVHFLVVLLVITMVNLGFWQLRRLHERRSSNAQITARTREVPVPLTSVASPDTSGEALSSLRYRAVSATGTYVASGDSVVVGRTQSGAPGGWVATPMTVGSDTVLVLRGFAGLGQTGSVVPPPIPTGLVTVEGYALAIKGFDQIARHDLSAMRDTQPSTLPVVLQARASSPTDDRSLTPIGLPPLDDGPHLSYAIQWFLFSTIAVIGYPLALRRTARSRGSATRQR